MNLKEYLLLIGTILIVVVVISGFYILLSNLYNQTQHKDEFWECQDCNTKHGFADNYCKIDHRIICPVCYNESLQWDYGYMVVDNWSNGSAHFVKV